MLISALILGWGCEKEALPSPATGQADFPEGPSIVFRSEGDSVPTILGAQRDNPYTVANMTLAWNYLFGQHKPYTALPATHHYVKFDPQSLEEYKVLAESGIDYVDFPLGYEVVQLGDYYPQEGSGPEHIPDFYGVVEAGEPIPAVAYQVLEDLVIPPYRTPLTARGFRQTTGARAYRKALSSSGKGPILDPCDKDCPNYPNCFYFPQYFGCSGPPIFNEDCTPDSPDWPDCMVIYDDGEEELNDCGCPVPNDSRTPAGCIQVEDVERNGLFPVEAVGVTWWDGYFSFKKTETDAQGCWKMSGHREYGKAYMWVTFINSRARLRGFMGNTVQAWRLLSPVTDYVGQLGGGTYNNIETEYNIWNNQGGRDHRNWSAATVMNALHHFHTEAQNDGINPPPMGLDIYLTANRTDGIALMASQIPPQFIEQWTLQGLFGLTLLPEVIDNLGLFGLVPDVAIGCNFLNSDEQWAITQHEIAHTSHFTNVGAVFWGQLGLATLNAQVFTGSPWGDANVADAGRIAICESWAEHLEHVYTDRAYGGNTSINEPWLDRLDRWRNHRPNHVPIGLHLDLLDNIEPATSDDRFGGGSGAVIDNVTGLTNGQLFSILDAATDDPQVYRQRIINDLLPGSGIEVGDVDALFNSY